jgi:hypothetical protein
MRSYFEYLKSVTICVSFDCCWALGSTTKFNYYYYYYHIFIALPVRIAFYGAVQYKIIKI